MKKAGPSSDQPVVEECDAGLTKLVAPIFSRRPLGERDPANPDPARGGAFSSRIMDACLANLHLRSPARILMHIARFHILGENIQAVDWELFLPVGTDPAVPRFAVPVITSATYTTNRDDTGK